MRLQYYRETLKELTYQTTLRKENTYLFVVMHREKLKQKLFEIATHKIMSQILEFKLFFKNKLKFGKQIRDSVSY